MIKWIMAMALLFSFLECHRIQVSNIKIRNYDCLVNQPQCSSHVTIKQKKIGFQSYSLTTVVPWHINLLYIGLPITTLQAANLTHACLPLLWEALTHFPRSQTILLQPILSIEASTGFLSSGCFILALKNLEMHSMDVVMCEKTKVVIDQFDDTFSWVDELLVLDKI